MKLLPRIFALYGNHSNGLTLVLQLNPRKALLGASWFASGLSGCFWTFHGEIHPCLFVTLSVDYRWVK